MKEELLKSIDEEIENATDALIRDIVKLVRIDSVRGEPANGAPFGLGPKQVLDTVIEMGQAEGFCPVDYGMGVASISMHPGQPDLGIWLHGDVVPVGDGWIYPPFEGVVHDNCVIGRGATDNKGQLVAVFQLLKIFKSLEIPLRYNPAIYVGSNEETGMQDVIDFLSTCIPPRLSLVPDAGFPVGQGGKGGLNLTFRSKKPLTDLVITAGQPDSPGRAEADLYGKKISAETPPRHGAHPDPNGNMITLVMDQLLQETNVAKDDIPVLQFCKDASLDTNGKKFGIYVESVTMSALTVFARAIDMQDGHLQLYVNIRYPIETTAERVIQQMRQVAESCGMELADAKPGVNPYMLDSNDPVLQMLCQVANSVTGSDAKPYTMGGGTYAHRLPNAYAFGMSGNRVPADFPEGHGGAHGKDESVGIDRLQRAMKIYARALLALNEMQW